MKNRKRKTHPNRFMPAPPILVSSTLSLLYPCSGSAETISPRALFCRLFPPESLAPWPHIVEPHQVNLLASTVLRHLQQIQHAQKPRLPCQFRSNVRETDRLNRIDLDRPFSHRVSRANSHMRTHPEPHAARNFLSPNALAQPLREHHGLSLPRPAACIRRQCSIIRAAFRSLYGHPLYRHRSERIRQVRFYP